jgi:Prealbumin-like fold domain
VTSGATSQCFFGNTLPCWGNRIDLSGNAEGAVNTGDVTDPIAPDAPRTLTAGLFGEAAINLTAAGVFPPGACELFGSAFLKSRSSSSFGAEVKDFIAPVPVNIATCGEIKIIKRTDPRGINQDFGFTSTLAGLQLTCTQPTPTSFTLNDNGNSTGDSSANTQDCTKVPLGSYTVTEGAEPLGFALESLTSTATGSGSSSGAQDATNPAQANITLAAGDDTVTCVYVNKQQHGAIKITKTGKDKNCTGANTPSISNGVCTGPGTADLSGGVFTIKDSNGNPVSGSPATTGDDGTVCVDGLVFGAYSVQETAAPTGYAIDDSTAHTVTVDNNATCSDVPYVGESIGFTDTPLTDLLVKATSEVPGGTQSTITCVDASNANVGNSPQGPSDPAEVDANALKPGTYTCTVVVDP